MRALLVPLGLLIGVSPGAPGVAGALRGPRWKRSGNPDLLLPAVTGLVRWDTQPGREWRP